MRAKIGYMAILVLMGFLYLWTNVAVTFYLFFGLLLFAILSFLLNWYAARHLTMHLQVNQDLNQVSTILIYVKNTGIKTIILAIPTANLLLGIVAAKDTKTRLYIDEPNLLKNADIAKALKDLFSLKIFIFHFLQKKII